MTGQAVAAGVRPTSRLEDYLALSKPRVVLLIAVTVAVGFYVGAGPVVDVGRLILAVLGAGIAGAGSLALNMLLEREHDARMQRTRDRPLPGGRLQPTEALVFGVALVIAGLAVLALLVNPASAGITALTVGLYLFAYTPLKRRSSISTLIGAIPGALPPVTGWVAARGELGPGAWALFGLLFFWQIPHSLAIARLYRDDYQAAGFRLLPVVDPEGGSTARQSLLHSIALLGAGMLPALVGVAGQLYLVTSVVLGVVFLAYAIGFARDPSVHGARRLFVASLVYMPIILVLLAVDRTGV